jgi:hypothetical protein
LGLIAQSWRLAIGTAMVRLFAKAIHLRTWLLVLSLATVSLLAACASGPHLVNHAFSFDGWFDHWADQVDLLEYSYGDQYRLVQDKVAIGRERLRPQASVNGAIPVGNFLYVKWRIKSTGEVIEDRVDLKSRLPTNMTDHRLAFVIDQRQLYVYLVTPQPKNEYAEPLLRTTQSRYHVTYELYPTNTYKQK